MGESRELAAILGWTGFGAVIAFVLALFHVRVAPRRRLPDAPPRPLDPGSALAAFQRRASLVVTFAFLALVLAAWAAGTRAGTGFVVAVAIAVPPVVGLGALTARRRPADSGEAGASPSPVSAAGGENPS